MPNATTLNPQTIENALNQVGDETSFIQHLLIDTLGWDLPPEAERIDELGYAWEPAELKAAHLGKKLVNATAHQILLPDGPWGVFLLNFKNPDAFTHGRGLTGPLRAVLRGLVPKLRRDPNLPAFKRDNLLFICTHQFSHYRFAYFKNPADTTKTPPLAMFGFSPDEPARTACEINLPHLAWPTDTDPIKWTADWAAAFDVERVTKRFYEDYKRDFEQAESLIGSASKLDQESLRLYTQTLFNRLMFVRFLERKGWLTYAGHADYLQALQQAGGIAKESLYQSRLRPLFFDALAKPEADRDSDTAERVGVVPFLNGGLFEPNPLDAKVPDIPDAVFDALLAPADLGGLFYKYHFTIEESTPLDVEVAVDPEMLGKVFEELVTGRHESGSYYTPRPVVAFMCREALKGYLAPLVDADPQALENLVDHHTIEPNTLTDAQGHDILAALSRLKAVDPACGSGAYLLGLMQEILAIQKTLQPKELATDPDFLGKRKLEIISRSLYGVDIDPFATSIAMLRLWLSLAVEADQPTPLPNLDFKIETGDALLGPDPQAVPDLFREQLRTRADVLVNLKDKYLRSHGDAKTKLRAAINREETVIREGLDIQVGPGIIDWRVQFAEAFIVGPETSGGGFDVVFANPPYVRRRNIGRAVTSKLDVLYADATTGQSDLYCSFYARGLQLLRSGGMHVFICSSAWLDAEYGAKLQKYILDVGEILAVVDSDFEKQFSTANVNTALTVVRKSNASTRQPTSFVLLQAPFDLAVHDASLQRERTISHQELRRIGTGANGYTGAKWGGELLRAPEIFWDILKRSGSRLSRLDQVATIEGYIHDNNTGEAHPEQSVLWKISDINELMISEGHPALTRIGIKATGNSMTYSPIVIARQHGRRHIVPVLQEPVLAKEFYKIIPHKVEDILPLAAQLNSSLGFLQRELLGIRGFGGGALKFAARDISMFRVARNLRSEALVTAFQKACSRPLIDPIDEMATDERVLMDEIIFDSLGLSSDDLQAVREAIASLLRSRVERARS